MAREPTRLRVVISRRAQLDLDEIWEYNVNAYGLEHADRYLSFLEDETARLAVDYKLFATVPNRPGLQRMTIRKGRGHGHVAVFEVKGETVEVLRYFHTAQDWQGRQ